MEFESIFNRFSSTSAVVDLKHQLSYRSLEFKVDEIVAQLAAAGAEQGDFVGVYARRSIMGLASFLAVLKIGAVYVPLDPAILVSRLREQISSVKLRYVLLQNEEMMNSLEPLDESVKLIPIAKRFEEVPAVQTNIVDQKGSDGAYLVFTSGTTGQPKPVLVSLANLHHHTVSIIEAYELNSRDKVLQICSPGFDVSIEEMIPSICAGSTLVMGVDPKTHSLVEIHNYLCEQEISIINLPTALWLAWIRWIKDTKTKIPSSLRLIVIGSEACPNHAVQEWLDVSNGQIRCLNCYGLSETTITNLYWELPTSISPDLPPRVSIGMPLRGNSAYVLDENLEIVPNGTTGKLFIGGNGVCNGYFKATEEEQQKFVADSFSSERDCRLFDTGDLAYYDVGLGFVLVGRVDRQVKIRGIRVELPMIECQLAQLEFVSQAAVKINRIGNVDILVAFIIPSQNHHFTVGKFHSSATEELAVFFDKCNETFAYHECPTNICILSEFPLTVNGKIDYNMLPDMDSTQTKTTASSGSYKEHCLEFVLGFLPQELSLSFIACGGDSISGSRLVSMLHRGGYKLSLKGLLGRESLEQILDSIEQFSDDEIKYFMETRLISIGLTRNELIRLHSSLANWSQIEFICGCSSLQLVMLEYSLAYPRHGYFIEQVEGVLIGVDIDNFKRAWSYVAEQHASLRTEFSFVVANKPIQICRNITEMCWRDLSFEDLESSQHSGKLTQFLANDRKAGFDFLVDSPHRLTLIKLDADRYHFVWTYHHALLDGWSDTQILDLVFSAYKRLSNRQLPVVKPSPDYRSFVSLNMQMETKPSLTYWETYLGGLKDPKWLLSLQSVSELSGHMKVISAELDKQAIQGYCSRVGVTLSTLFTGVLGSTIGHITDQTEIVIGTVVSVRPNEIEFIDQATGLYINVVPARVTLTSENKTASWLRQIQTDLISREGHCQIPTEQLISLAETDSDQIFDSVLVVENYRQAENSEVSKLTNHSKSSFPITVFVKPGEKLLIEMNYDHSYLGKLAAERFFGIMDDVIGEIIC